MISHYDPINPRFPHLLHGGDYNPEQWTPDVWVEDMRLMPYPQKTSSVNAIAPELGKITS